MQFINIEGWPASGKTILWSLFQSSNDIFVEPLHSTFVYVGLELSSDISLRDYRLQLALSEFYKNEQFSDLGYFQFTYGNGKIAELPFNLDFASFERLLTDWFKASIDRNIKGWYDIYTRSYLKVLNQPKSFKYFASYSDYSKVEKLLNSELKFKTIAVLRSPEGIIQSRS